MVDGAVNGLGWIVHKSGAGLRNLQTGRLPTYLAGMTIGTVLVVVLTRFLLDVLKGS